jgi:hypothetical protein
LDFVSGHRLAKRDRVPADAGQWPKETAFGTRFSPISQFSGRYNKEITIMKTLQQNRCGEWTFISQNSCDDQFNQIELKACFTHADSGAEKRVPAFWAGGREWRVRFAAHEVGIYRFRTECSDTSDRGLHGQEGEVKVVPYRGKNPLFRHGPVGVAADRRHFEHADGTPFFWLGDTWWMGLCQRLEWPHGFRTLAADRMKKGFSVVQIVAGLYPDMPAFDPRGANEAGFPWTEDYACINPAYFDAAAAGMTCRWPPGSPANCTSSTAPWALACDW